MAEGSKPEVFHSDDIQSEYLDQPGKPVGKFLFLFQEQELFVFDMPIRNESPLINIWRSGFPCFQHHQS